MPLEDGSALRLTTAKYYTPSHKVIHERGITPDAVVPMSAEEEEALFYKRVLGGFESLDDAQKERIREIRDVQYDRAHDYLKGILMYRDRASHRQSAPRQLAAQRP
jgi:carboxyl-terminal processing protease